MSENQKVIVVGGIVVCIIGFIVWLREPPYKPPADLSTPEKIEKAIYNKDQQFVMKMLGKPTYVEGGLFVDHSDDEVWVYPNKVKHPITRQSQNIEVHFKDGLCIDVRVE
jgi:hypothetical protein